MKKRTLTFYLSLLLAGMGTVAAQDQKKAMEEEVQMHRLTGKAVYQIWKMNSEGAEKAIKGILRMGQRNGWTIMGTGDFNGDGMTDILWDKSQYNYEIWEINANKKKGWRIGRIAIGYKKGWEVAGVGDFDGDGIADIIWEHGKKNFVIWKMSSSGYVEDMWKGIRNGWEVAGTGDFDGDSVVDIVWVQNRDFIAMAPRKTGQYLSYDENGTVVKRCTVKDDGCYQKGVTPNFTRDDAKEVVTDKLTGLMWQDNDAVNKIRRRWITQEAWEKCNGYNGYDKDPSACDDTSGETASTYCANLRLGGYNDWRLPSLEELWSITTKSGRSPALNQTFKNNGAKDWYSTRTGQKSSIYRAWAINMANALTETGNKVDPWYIRCVRGGK